MLHLVPLVRFMDSYLYRCLNGGKLFVTLCKIWPVWDLNSRPPAQVERNAHQPFGRRGVCCKYDFINTY